MFYHVIHTLRRFAKTGFKNYFINLSIPRRFFNGVAEKSNLYQENPMKVTEKLRNKSFVKEIIVQNLSLDVIVFFTNFVEHSPAFT